MKVRIILVVALLSFLNPLFAWSQSIESKDQKPLTTNDSLANQRETLENNLAEFDSATKELRDEVKKGKDTLLTFQEAIKVAIERNAEFKKVYTIWQTIEEKNQSVIEKFKGLVKAADDFYLAAESHANTIHDPSLKNDAIQAISISKKTYTDRLKATKEKLKEVSALKLKVDDTMKYLEIVQSIKVIEEKIKEAFDQIDSLVSSLMQELNQLKLESENLLRTAQQTSQQNQDKR